MRKTNTIIALVLSLMISGLITGCNAVRFELTYKDKSVISHKTVDVSTKATEERTTEGEQSDSNHEQHYEFRNDKYLEQHYEKHGKDMGFTSSEDYEESACEVINNPKALHKFEKEDNDEVFYIEETNEFVVLSTDGYIRTYFEPDKGISYYNKQ